VSVAASSDRVQAASIAYPLQDLALAMTDYQDVIRSWILAYHGVCVDTSTRKRKTGGGHFDIYRREDRNQSGLGEIDWDGEDISGDVLMDASMFDRVAQAYTSRAAHEFWLTLYWAGDPDLPTDRKTPIVRVGISLQPASEAIL
jgi:hypothetical protein